MDFVKKSIQSQVAKLLEFRGKYDKQVYSTQVIKNLFFDLYTDRLMLNFVFTNMVQIGQLKDYDEAHSYLRAKRSEIQLREVNPNLESFLELDLPITDSLIFSSFYSRTESANNGNNKEVEDIEYTYVFYGLVSDIIFRWVCVGLTGKGARDACYIVTEMLPGNANFDSFEGVVETFSTVAGLYLAGQNATTGKNFGLYTPIAPLW